MGGRTTKLMARASTMLAVAVAVLATAAESKVNSTIPRTEKGTIDGTEILGPSAGDTALKASCAQFARDAVNDAARPNIEVCGTSTKVTVYLRNRCEDYHTYTHEIGTCSTGASPSSCVSASPATVEWMQTAQSYKITTC